MKSTSLQSRAQILPDVKLPAFELNKKGSFPKTVEEYILHAQEWKKIVAKYAPIFEEHRVMPYRAQTVSMKLIRYHLEYVAGLSEVWTLKALGADPEAKARLLELETTFGRHEFEIGTCFDQRMCFSSFGRIIYSQKTFYEAD